MKFNLRSLKPNFSKISPATRQGLFWLIGAMLLPVALAYYQTISTGHSTVEKEAQRVINFFLNEAERTLADTERLMDAYIHKTGGSCRAADIVVLSRFVATNEAADAMGIVAPDGKVACTVGELDLKGLSFPPAKSQAEKGASFAQLKLNHRVVPVIVKGGRGNIRVFSVMSVERFTNVLLPQFMIDFAQIDIILPRGGLWFTLTGNAITGGFSGNIHSINKASERYPISVSLVLDGIAGDHWGGSLRSSLIILIGICVSAIVALWLFFATIAYYRRKLKKRFRKRVGANARDMFELRYRPILDLKTNLLVGVVVECDMRLFMSAKEHAPKPAEIMEMAWAELKQFAKKRRRVFILFEFEGEEVIDPAHRPIFTETLATINYPDMMILLNWQDNKGTETSTYRHLEEITAPGCLLALECSSVRFSLLSDMWTWPYHRLIVDFQRLPRLEESIIWTSEIVVDLAEQLQINTLAMGLYDKPAVDLAIGSGFELGCGDEIGPALPIDVFLSVVRPVSKSEEKEAA